MRIGLDFDNTIVRYDRLFHELAVERDLVPPETPATKEGVRDWLRRTGREPAWTELQGYVYGPGMERAEPFPGALEFLARCGRGGVWACVISHRTRRPFLGPAYDLHESAFQWLERHGFFDPARLGMKREQVLLEETKEGKLSRISEMGCTHFIDDLPEFLQEPRFPARVRRILFDPNGRHAGIRELERASAWEELEARLLRPMELLQDGVSRLLESCGLRGKFALSTLPGAANNQVFLLELEGRERFLLKAYFRHPEDPRDRLGAEFAFSAFTWRNEVRALPKPVAQDQELGLGLYQFIEGRRLAPEEVTQDRVREALAFYQAVNRRRHLPEAHALGVASEACFSMEEHLRCVEGRLERLARTVDPEASAFARNELSPAWARVRKDARRRAGELGLPLAGKLATKDRRLSPSDFGFHNALLGPDGRLRFIDFEYAGWDDPAKLVCDFFCQVEVPVPPAHYRLFAQSVAADLDDPEAGLNRFELLLPVYRIKWCCIMLNDFLPEGMARRRYALGAAGAQEHRRGRLELARRFLQEALHA